MLEEFTPESPFVTEDNRRKRPVLPTTADLLNTRHARLMPVDVVRGKTVLDLGCCIGATGQWVMSHGAAQYTGVEHQELYAQQASALLAQWPNARVIAEDATRFAADEQGTWDVVALLGVVHGLYDPLSLIRDAAACAAKFFCFEDFGLPGEAPVMQCGRSIGMPLAGEFAGTRGFGWAINPAAMHLIMEFLGFAPDMEPHFIIDERWLCRYRRVGAPLRSSAYSKEVHPWTR